MNDYAEVISSVPVKEMIEALEREVVNPLKVCDYHAWPSFQFVEEKGSGVIQYKDVEVTDEASFEEEFVSFHCHFGTTLYRHFDDGDWRSILAWLATRQILGGHDEKIAALWKQFMDASKNSKDYDQLIFVYHKQILYVWAIHLDEKGMI